MRTKYPGRSGSGEAPSEGGGSPAAPSSPGPPVDAGEAAHREDADGRSVVDTSPASPTTSVDAVPSMSLEEWMELGDQLLEEERRLPWMIGDWWNLGEQRFGEEAAAALPDHQGNLLERYALQTIYNYASVARCFPPDERNYAVPFSHHDALAKRWLAEAERRELLAEAASEQMTVKDVRARVRELKGSTTEQKEPNPHADPDGSGSGEAGALGSGDSDLPPEGPEGGAPVASPSEVEQALDTLAAVAEAVGGDPPDRHGWGWAADYSDDGLVEIKQACRVVTSAVTAELHRRAET